MGFPALWWWIDRWRKSSAFSEMTNEEQGAYRNLLDEAALRGGPLPNNDRVLAKASGDAVGWTRVRDVVLGHFTLGADGCWHNATLEKVLAESARRAAAQKRYRETHNAPHNAKANGANNSAHNKPHSPNTHLLSVKKKGRNRICPHTPTCATWSSCTTRILEDGRKEKAGKG